MVYIALYTRSCPPQARAIKLRIALVLVELEILPSALRASANISPYYHLLLDWGIQYGSIISIKASKREVGGWLGPEKKSEVRKLGNRGRHPY